MSTPSALRALSAPLALLASLALPGLLLAACGGSEAEEQAIVIHPREQGSTDPGAGEGQEQGAQGELVLSEDPCESDADCVPADCCHPRACVAQANAPNCENTMCTADCRYGTLDCGGACLCHEGRCAARLSVPPRLGTVEGEAQAE